MDENDKMTSLLAGQSLVNFENSCGVALLHYVKFQVLKKNVCVSKYEK